MTSLDTSNAHFQQAIVWLVEYFIFPYFTSGAEIFFFSATQRVNGCANFFLIILAARLILDWWSTGQLASHRLQYASISGGVVANSNPPKIVSAIKFECFCKLADCFLEIFELCPWTILIIIHYHCSGGYRRHSLSPKCPILYVLIFRLLYIS